MQNIYLDRADFNEGVCRAEITELKKKAASVTLCEEAMVRYNENE